MPSRQTLITVNDLGPAKLISRLAKHWAHKFEVEHDDGRAFIPFPAATCLLEVRDGRLYARLEAGDEPTLEKMQQVVTDHLQRMARGEALEVDWEPVG